MRTFAWFGLVAVLGCSPHGDVAPDAMPDAPPDATLPTGVVAVPLEGCPSSFTGVFSIGGAPFSLIVDTGSGPLAVAGSACTACTAAGVDALYTPGSGAIDDHQTLTVPYADGQISWTGEEYRDRVGVGDTSFPMSFYAITDEQGFFEPGECGAPDGIVGMQGEGLTSLPSMYASAGRHDIFAMTECRSHATLWLGGYDPSAITAPPTYVAMPDDYDADLTDIAVGGTSIGLPATTYGEAIIDSGGPSIIVPEAAYDAITSAVAANPTFAAAFGDATWFASGNCTAPTLSKAQLDAALPALTVQLDATTVEMAATDSYLTTIDRGPATYYCSALAADPSFLDLGDSLIRSHVVIFDREQRQLGVAPSPPCT